MMYDYLPSRLNIRCIPEENSAFDQRMSFRTDIRNRISTSGPTTYDSMEKIIMICIHYKNKHPPLIAVCTYIMYTTTSTIHLAKRAFIHYCYIYLMQFIGTCSVLREQKKRCQVSGVRCQLSGCRVGGSRAQTDAQPTRPPRRISNNYARDMGIGRDCRESNRLYVSRSMDRHISR